jgi:hypothetical protein
VRPNSEGKGSGHRTKMHGNLLIRGPSPIGAYRPPRTAQPGAPAHTWFHPPATCSPPPPPHTQWIYTTHRIHTKKDMEEKK